MFIGRRKELDSLNKRYQNNNLEFLVIKGRRRVGKSTLLREFCKDKNDFIYFTAQERNKKESLIQLSLTVNYYMNAGNSVFQDFQSLFQKVFEISKEKRLIFIIDEFPYLANSDKSLMSILQYLIDINKDNSKMLLIICGSSISFMENKVLAYKAPLYGRSTGQMTIKPFFFDTSRQYFTNYSLVDQVIAYSVFGGIPAYLNLIDNTKPIKQNIIDNFLDPDANLYDEPSRLVKEELRETAVYNSIIDAIANGYTKNNEISTKIDEPKDKTNIYLKNLIELQIIKREHPITNKLTSKKSIYSLNDNLFKFWYRFISINKSKIEFSSNKSKIYDELIKPYLEEYVSIIFEDICKEFMLLNISNESKVLPFSFDQIGKWWGSDPKTKSEEEIDILAFNNNKIYAFFLECKWRNEKVKIDIIKNLERKSNLLEQFKNKYYGIFSKSGFSNELIEYSKTDSKIYLYNLDDICRNHN